MPNVPFALQVEMSLGFVQTSVVRTVRTPVTQQLVQLRIATPEIVWMPVEWSTVRSSRPTFSRIELRAPHQAPGDRSLRNVGSARPGVTVIVVLVHAAPG